MVPSREPATRYSREHFKTASRDEWIKRPDRTAKRSYQSLIGEQLDPTGASRFYDGLTWHLALGEAFNNHPKNFEVVSACRVMPLFSAHGGLFYEDAIWPTHGILTVKP